MVVKVSDFGVSKLMTTSAATALFDALAGTPAFLAPEVFREEPYTFSVDVFSLGLVFLAMIQHTQGDSNLYPRFGKIAMICLILAKLVWPTTSHELIDVSCFVVKRYIIYVVIVFIVSTLMIALEMRK